MQARIIPFNSASTIQITLQVLQAGGVIAFPTDTVYGIGVSVFDKDGIDRLYMIKERSNLKAIPVLIGLAEQLNNK